MVGRPINKDRQNAIDLGLKTYIGAEHAKCGTNIRYVNGGGCVHCAKVIASEQRDAMKFVREMERQKVENRDEDLLDERIEEQIENHEEFAPPIDSTPGDGLDAEEDAETRRQASFDELM